MFSRQSLAIIGLPDRQYLKHKYTMTSQRQRIYQLGISLNLALLAMIFGSAWLIGEASWPQPQSGAILALPHTTSIPTSLTTTVNITSSKYAYLPVISLSEPLSEAILRLTPSGGINASTYNPGSFLLINHSSHNQKISHVGIDLSTAMFPDMVFDPNGVAGDLVAKDLEVNSDPAVVGFQGHAFDGSHDDGFDVLEITFNDFDPGEQFAFSIDVDPTSIRGVNAPGPNESGSVSGLELVGTTVTVTFADGTIAIGYSYRLPDSLSGSEALVRNGLPASPLVEVYGIPTPPATVANPNQTLRVTGVPGSTARVLVVEGGLFTDGLPGGGFDITPFEAHSAIQVQEYSGIVGATGVVDIPFMLTRSHADGGLNHIVVVLENSYAMKGMTSSPIVLELQD